MSELEDLRAENSMLKAEIRRCPKCQSGTIRVKWNHVDGPMMTRPDGTLKWLTYRERLMHWLGFWTLEDIAQTSARSHP